MSVLIFKIAFYLLWIAGFLSAFVQLLLSTDRLAKRAGGYWRLVLPIAPIGFLIVSLTSIIMSITSPGRVIKDWLFFPPFMAASILVSFVSLAIALNWLTSTQSADPGRTHQSALSHLWRLALAVLVNLMLGVGLGSIKSGAEQSGLAAYTYSPSLTAAFGSNVDTIVRRLQAQESACTILLSTQHPVDKKATPRGRWRWLVIAVGGRIEWTIPASRGALIMSYVYNDGGLDGRLLSFRPTGQDGRCDFPISTDFVDEVETSREPDWSQIISGAHAHRERLRASLESPVAGEISFLMHGYANLMSIVGAHVGSIAPANEAARWLDTILLWLNYLLTGVVFVMLERGAGRREATIDPD